MVGRLKEFEGARWERRGFREVRMVGFVIAVVAVTAGEWYGESGRCDVN